MELRPQPGRRARRGVGGVCPAGAVVVALRPPRSALRTAPGRSSLPVGLLRLGTVGVALVPVGVYLVVALRQLGYPYELEWMEGGSVEIVGRVLRGQAIYTAPSLHYVSYTYP